MKRAGGGFDASYNAQTAVDEAAHLIVAAELTNNGRDAAELPRMLQAVKKSVLGFRQFSMRGLHPEGEGASNRSAAQAPSRR